MMFALALWVHSDSEATIMKLNQPQSGDTISLDRGIYDITVTYRSDHNGNVLTFLPENETVPCLVDPLRCYSFQNEGKLRLWMFGTNQKIVVSQSQEDPNATFVVSQVTLKATNGLRKLFMTIFSGIWILIDAIYLWWKQVFLRSDNRKATVLCTLVILIAIGVCSSYVIDPALVGGSDYKFHLARILGMAESMESGVFPPRILPFFFGDAGYATSLFYGDLLFTIPALLYIGGVPLYIAYHLFCLLISVGTAVICWQVFRIFAGRIPALAATVVYTCALYRQFILITHARVGESIAMAVLPLAVGGMYLILREADDRAKVKQGVRMLSAGMAVLVMNHTLSTLLCTLLLIVWIVPYINVVLRKNVLAAGLKAVGISALLAAIFLVPFAEVMQSGAYEISAKVAAGDMWWMWLDRYSLKYLWPGDPYDAMYGLLPTLLHAVCCGYVLLRLVRKDTRNRETFHLAVMTGMSMLWLFLASGWFPWDLAGNYPVFSFLKRTIQFPSRFAALATICLAFAICDMLRLIRIEEKTKQICRVAVFTGLAVILVNTGVYVSALTDETQHQAFPVYSAAGMDMDSPEYPASYTADYFYLMKGTDPYQFTEMTDWKNKNSELLIQDYVKNGTNQSISCENLTDEVQYIKLPVIYYPYYQGETESGEKITITGSDTNAMIVSIPANYQGIINIRVMEPWYWTAAIAVSILSWGWMLYRMLCQKKCS